MLSFFIFGVIIVFIELVFYLRVKTSVEEVR